MLDRIVTWVLVLLRILPASRPGWEALVQDAANGRTVWDPPLPGKNKLIGAPLEWVNAVADADEPSGFRLVLEPCRCTDCQTSSTPLEMTPDTCARCARCGVPLDLRHAGVRNSFEVPSCPRCRSRVKALV